MYTTRVKFIDAWERHRGNYRAVADELEVQPETVLKRANRLLQTGTPICEPVGVAPPRKTLADRQAEILSLREFLT